MVFETYREITQNGERRTANGEHKREKAERRRRQVVWLRGFRVFPLSELGAIIRSRSRVF